jgi:hypothetical protein
MSDPADKSDDLIAELARLMAAPAKTSSGATLAPARPVPPAGAPAPAPAQSAPPPIRIPGMDAPRPVAAAPQPAAVSAPPPPMPRAVTPTAAPTRAAEPQRAPVTGSIRIPGMDQPAPVTSSAPVPKFDFGRPVAPAAPIHQEPLSTLSERLAAQNPAPPPAPPAAPRIPSDLRPVSESRSFAHGPAITVAPPVPAAPAPIASTPAPDFDFDFGLDAPAPPPPPAERAASKDSVVAEEDDDPIASLIEAEFADTEEGRDDAPEPQAAREEAEAETPAPPKPPAFTPVAVPRPSPPLKPVNVAPRAVESDSFAVAPGLGIKPPVNGQPLGAPVARTPEPAPKAPAELSDPMAEIESLIGEAVRVELSAPAVKSQPATRVEPHMEFEPAAPAPAPNLRANAPAAPVVPPLTTQFAPRRSGLKDDAGHDAAEEAILAAAAATGAAVDRLEPAVGDESPYRRVKVKSSTGGGLRQYVGMAVAGTLLLAAGLGLYWVLNMGRNNADTAATAPQLTADATPVKEIPAADAAEPETPRSPVLEQMDGTANASAEQLVSTDETATTPVTRDVTNVAAADTEGGLANRKVRTVTVRPDGTIVSGDDAVAGAEELPVERPNVPELPGTATTALLGTSDVATAEPLTDDTVTGTAPTPLTATMPSTPPPGSDAAVQPVFNTGIVAPTPHSFPVRSTATQTASVSTTTTGSGQIDLVGSTTPAASSGTAAAYVQLSSSPSQADAQASLRTLTNRYGSLFGGQQLVVQSANLGQKGTWYRVKLPASSMSEAQSVCASIKANGGDCIITD